MEGAEAVIRVTGVHKRFRKFATRGQYTTLKSSLVQRLFGRGERTERFLQVLEGIDLVVPRGKAVGIIGRNGSGKSTLLKLVAGILKPDAGRIEVHGRVSPLIELGAGFHPEFSGRENVYLNGIVLGLTRGEVDERFDAIVDFADLREFIDDPVRTYSSGMYMRLGFSIAVHASPDVLLIDEILAVGDQSFARKCAGWITAFLDRGGSILLVSHDLAAVSRWCDEILWLEDGRVRMRGKPRDVIAGYVGSIDGDVAVPDAASAGEVIRRAQLLGEEGGPCGPIRPGGTVLVELEYELPDGAKAPFLEMEVRRVDGVSCYATSSEVEGIQIPRETRRIRCRLANLPLLDGSYVVDLVLRGADRHLLDQRIAGSFTVASRGGQKGICRLEHEWEFE